MIDLKVFILHNNIHDFIDIVAKLYVDLPGNFPNLDIRKETYLPGMHLPSDYDLYILHLDDVDSIPVKKIKESQPYSKIYGVGGGFRNGNFPGTYSHMRLEEVRNLFDSYSENINFNRIKDLIENSWVAKSE